MFVSHVDNWRVVKNEKKTSMDREKDGNNCVTALNMNDARLLRNQDHGV